LHLAVVEERSGFLEGALDNLLQAFGDVPTEHRFSVAVLATRFAARHDANLARDWLERTLDCAPNDLDAELSILELRLTIPALIEFHSADELLVALDRALVQQEWQAAYDLAMHLQLHELAALARVLYLANCLRERGAADAALDLLDRAIDVHPRTRALNWLLTSVLIDLDRYDDAHIAVEVLQLLRREEQSSTPALAA
jgi:tetratricopeptide (TPR) repeat protein